MIIVWLAIPWREYSDYVFLWVLTRGFAAWDFVAIPE